MYASVGCDTTAEADHRVYHYNTMYVTKQNTLRYFVHKSSTCSHSPGDNVVLSNALVSAARSWRVDSVLLLLLWTALIRPFYMRDFFFKVAIANRVLLCFQVSFGLLKRRNRAESSRNESDYSRRSAQTSFPLLESRFCENFGLAYFSIFLLGKKKLIKQTVLTNCQFSDYTSEK